ncbi:unnamed protein product [Schistosoma margrebowiei]|uniref:Uncharacterized protein n=1 Tax=Schistosoma margrebowiei TaxID=48269 RepID=A0A183N657_9TREM|nr:unnamed protein product [Schistosoma margrebowiei]
MSSEEKKLKLMILQSQSTDELIESNNDQTGRQVTAADVKTMKAQLSIGRYSLYQSGISNNVGRRRSVLSAWMRKELRADVTWIMDKFRELMENTLW